MRDQPIAPAIKSSGKPYHRRANTRTPKNATATPVCAEGNAWYLLRRNRSSPSRHRPFHSCCASILLGRVRPDTARTESTTAPAIVADNIMQTRSLQKKRLRAHQAQARPRQPQSINSGQSPQSLRSPAIFLTVFTSCVFTHSITVRSAKKLSPQTRIPVMSSPITSLTSSPLF